MDDAKQHFESVKSTDQRNNATLKQLLVISVSVSYSFRFFYDYGLFIYLFMLLHFTLQNIDMVS